MKIVFDNEKEKKRFIEKLVQLDVCPPEFGFEGNCIKWNGDCKECWDSGLKENSKKVEDWID